MKKENIHDRLFKHTLSIPSEAKALVRLFLPDWIHKNLDYRTFKLNDQSFVNETLDEYLTDIVYDCNWKGSVPIKLSFLLEHKSYPDKLTPLQLLRYLTEAYTLLLNDKEDKEKSTIIIPVVIYHDKAKWQKRTFKDLFDLPDQRLKGYLPNFDFDLINLPSVSDDFLFNLNSGFLLRSTLLVFKHKNDRNAVEQFSKEMFIFVQEHLNAQQKEAYTKALLLYIFQVFKFDKATFNTFTKKLPKMTGIVSGSLYDRLIKEGMEKGIEKGMEKGIEKGMEKGQFKTLAIAIRKMTIKKFALPMISEILEKPVSEIKKIQKELKQETKILAALKKKQTIPAIAKKLKVSEWLVETLQEISKKKKKSIS